jgi:hypothetical protein
MAPDLTDVRVLIPRVRRSLEGPFGSASGMAGATLEDAQVEALIADAIADVILYTGGLFGHQLLVAARDPDYGAPTKWKTDEQLTEPEGTVIVAEAALRFFYQSVKDMKVQESIANEGQSWSWSMSANAVVEWLKMLKGRRDEALAIVSQLNGIVIDGFTSYLAVRDSAVAAYIEPFASGYATGGQEFADPRFY